jgi:hypothetical protein
MCPTIDSIHFGTDSWNEAFYDVMAGVARTTRTVNEKAQETTKIIAFPVRLWLFERDMRAFVEFLHSPTKAADTSSEPVRPEEIAEKLSGLAESLENLYAICKRKGWTNRTVTAASLNSIHKQADIIQDFAEMVFIAIDPKTEERFKSAHQQFEAGETVGLDAIR